MAGDSPETQDEEDADRLVSGWTNKPEEKTRFKCGRDGDDLLVSFECDTCMFGKLSYRARPLMDCPKDLLAMACIRRINFDAFWSRAPRTVKTNTAQVRKMLEMSKALGLDGPFLPPGPLPVHDHCGYEVAMLVVFASLEKGKYSESHKQWDTIRKIRSAYSNHARAAAISNFDTLSLADNHGKSYERLAPDPCGSLWFQRFMAGCKKRMGQDWRPNKAVSVEIMADLLSTADRKVASEASDN